MTDNNNKKDFSESSEDSTLFATPESDASEKGSARQIKRGNLLKRQHLAIIVTLGLTLLVLVSFFTLNAIKKSHIRMAEKYDEIKELMLSNLSEVQLSELDTYATFSDWLAEHRSDLSISSMIERNEDFRAILDEEVSLDRMLRKISKRKNFANYIDGLADKSENSVKLIEGEVLGTSNRIYMYQPYDRNDIASIKVNNTVDSWEFYYDSEKNGFFVKNYPEATFGQEEFSSLVVTAGKPTVIERVFDKCESFSEYGLAEDQFPASFTVTSRSGESHTVYVGNMTAAGNGYYARHADRDALYVLAASLESTVFAELEAMITPLLAFPMQANDYYMAKDFAIISEDEIKVAITFLDEDVKNQLGLNSSYYMLHPGAYSVNSTEYIGVLQTLQNFEGTRTVVYAPEENDLIKYGLDAPMFRVSYDYDVTGEGKPIEQEIYFSKKTEDGVYYALSPLFNLIAEVDAETVEWLEWDLIRWVDAPIFMMNINEIATITVDSGAVVRTFDLTGIDRELVVTERETGIKPEVENFRQFYKVLLSTELQGYVRADISNEEVEKLKDSEPYLTLSFETRAKKSIVYKFYPYQTLRIFYTVEQVSDTSEPAGEFYIMSASMAKIISDAEKVMTNTAVDSEARN